MAVEERDHVVSPDRAAVPCKVVTIRPARSEGRVDLDVCNLARFAHRGDEGAAWRQVVVVLRLEEQGRGATAARGAYQQVPQLGGAIPRLGSRSAVRCRTIRNALGSENGLDAAERIASDGDALWKDE